MKKEQICRYGSLFFIFLIFVVVCILSNPVEQSCVLCDSAPHEPPCLINLKTGEVGELVVYRSGKKPLYTGGGTFSIIDCAGLEGYRDTGKSLVRINVPLETAPVRKSLFCRDCRKLLPKQSDTGYLLADLSDPQAPAVYPIRIGADCSIGRYAVSMTAAERNAVTLTVTGI